jgi:hypothetical protein
MTLKSGVIQDDQCAWSSLGNGPFEAGFDGTWEQLLARLFVKKI